MAVVAVAVLLAMNATLVASREAKLEKLRVCDRMACSASHVS